jgi:hypothetical protein
MNDFKDPALNAAFDGLEQAVIDAEIKGMKLLVYRAAVAEMVVTGILKDDAIFAGAEVMLRDHRAELEASGAAAAVQDALAEVRAEVRQMFAATK